MLEGRKRGRGRRSESEEVREWGGRERVIEGEGEGGCEGG